jgi:hypothetical protein
MPDQGQFAPKSGMSEKPQSGGSSATQTSGSKGQERQHGVKKEMGSVGRDMPDQSKERNTEIAVEAGHKGGHQRDSKR